MTTTTSSPTTLNGVDLQVLGDTVAAITASPELAATDFRSRSRWDDDRHVITTVDAFAAGDIGHRRFAEETLPLSPVLDLFVRGAPVATRLKVRGEG